MLIQRLPFPLQHPWAPSGSNAPPCRLSPSCRHTRAPYLPVPWQRPPSPFSGVHLAEGPSSPHATKLSLLQLSFPGTGTGTGAAPTPAEEPAASTEGWGDAHTQGDVQGSSLPDSAACSPPKSQPCTCCGAKATQLLQGKPMKRELWWQRSKEGVVDELLKQMGISWSKQQRPGSSGG